MVLKILLDDVVVMVPFGFPEVDQLLSVQSQNLRALPGVCPAEKTETAGNPFVHGAGVQDEIRVGMFRVQLLKKLRAVSLCMMFFHVSEGIEVWFKTTQ